MNCSVFEMDGKRFPTTCNIKLVEDNYKKSRTVGKNCYNKKKRKNKNKTSIQNQQPLIDSVNTNNNNRTLLFGPSFSGETYLMFNLFHEYPIEKFISSPNQIRNSIPIPTSKLSKLVRKSCLQTNLKKLS